MQDQWAADGPAFDSIIEERKFREVGSFATFLGFEITGLDSPEPCWRAVALGEYVLFHVRAGPPDRDLPADASRRVRVASGLASVHTLRSSLDEMTQRLLAGGGVLGEGDFLFAATDAMADNGFCGPPDATRSPGLGNPGRAGTPRCFRPPGLRSTQRAGRR